MHSPPQMTYVPGQVIYVPNLTLVPLYPRLFCHDHDHSAVASVTSFVWSPSFLHVGSRPKSLFQQPMGFQDRYIYTLVSRGQEHDTHIAFPAHVQIKDYIAWESRMEAGYDIIATTSLQLPVDSERLFFLKDRMKIGGSFMVVQSDVVSDKIGVKVVLITQSDCLVNATQVCFLTRETGGHGVGILGDGEFPHDWNTSESVRITITLPQSPHGKLSLKTFESNLPFICQSLTLDDRVTFQKLDILGDSAMITAKNIFADQVQLKATNAAILGVIKASESLSVSTSNARITGNFTCPKSVSVSTSNAPIAGRFSSSNYISLTTINALIDADVDLLHDGISCERTTSLKIQTTNGAINGTINVASLAPTSRGGSFDISAVTSHGKNTLKFPIIPPQAKLDIIAATQSGAISVDLDEAYEGDFRVQTSEKADVVWKKVSDPEGEGRLRYVSWNCRNYGGVRGRVWWGERDSGKGTVNIGTDSGEATLVM
ncbi:hypothetical protein BDN72DRAFT_494086 [Pluteus cervinus]|uniref:Uncharacterized protein n=1 Tax=Pluteus cervinus TaxID=181527 RepID=A0ACD3AZ68_9AGAR|nr:hypothetical protein BDN72DRAFT_494086 [Pluteus cervinus]